MLEVLQGILMAGVVVLAFGVLAVLWVRHRIRRELRIAPRIRSTAPTVWLVSPTAGARMHRRLRTAASAARLAANLDAGLAPLAEDVVAEALAIEPRVIAIARGRRAGTPVRRELIMQISDLEGVARRLTVLSAGSRDASDAPRLRDRVAALEAAREELAEIDLRAGLLRHG